MFIQALLMLVLPWIARPTKRELAADLAAYEGV
jgi:hypothetical protein